MLQILSAFLAILLACAGVHFVRRTELFDRAALLALILLAVGTRPEQDQHETMVANTVKQEATAVTRAFADRAALAATAATHLEYRDYLLLSIALRRGNAVSIGLFDRVFVVDGVYDGR